MDKNTLGIYLLDTLKKYNFKNYGNKLFYLELPECIVVLREANHFLRAELFLNIIIKKCHPEIKKVTKNIVSDKMMLDLWGEPRLLFSFENSNSGWNCDLLDIPETQFEEKIGEIYNHYILGFQNGVIKGIEHCNDFWKKEQVQDFSIVLFSDSAQIIGRPDWAADRGHDWFLSDRYLLVFEYGVDVRYVNKNTEKYIMQEVIARMPCELKGKARVKWCNERCKEIFLAKNKRFFFGWGIPFPFVDGKPLKYCGCQTKPGIKTKFFYINETTNEKFYLISTVREMCDLDNDKYELVKINE